MVQLSCRAHRISQVLRVLEGEPDGLGAARLQHAAAQHENDYHKTSQGRRLALLQEEADAEVVEGQPGLLLGLLRPGAARGQWDSLDINIHR